VIGKSVYKTGAAVPGRGRMAVSPEVVFELEIGRNYIIMGMGIFESDLSVLVCDETGKPNWLPIGLFEIPAGELPSGWEFCLCDPKAASGGESLNRWVAKWGYRELVRNPDHSDGLIERDPEALKIFFEELAKRGEEIE
jgi:hypothetical protein